MASQTVRKGRSNANNTSQIGMEDIGPSQSTQSASYGYCACCAFRGAIRRSDGTIRGHMIGGSRISCPGSKKTPATSPFVGLQDEVTTKSQEPLPEVDEPFTSQM